MRKLAHLLAVAEAQSFRKACDVVHLSQPALFRSVQSLEDDLGIRLLERKYGRVELTRHSVPIVEKARRLIEEARAFEEAVRRVKGLEEGDIRIGFGPFASATVLPSVMKEVIGNHPGLHVAIEITHSKLLVEHLKNGRLDIAIGDSRSVFEEDDISMIKLPKQEISLVARREHALFKNQAITFDALRAHSLGAPTLPSDLISQFAQVGVAHWPTVTCDDLKVLLQLASETDLIIMVPKLVARQALTDALSLVALDLPFDQFAYPCIITSTNYVPGPAGSLVIQLIERELMP
ncbi:LysR family transcriptional regulator [Cupriavidus necator]|uniref:LysR family transcriptional regulator n=1 Tax=Cupriavidus necator TaxID=106590 RepID=A0A1U9UN24_CUPNE|nr:LysR family transcriptional regulator [Cupriavidus necator]